MLTLQASAPHKQGKESPQTSLQQVQMERRTDSRRQVDPMEKMLSLLEDLQAIKSSGDQNLQEAQNETWQLNKKVEALEGNIKKLCQTLLSHEKTVSSTIASDRQTESDLLAEHVKSDDRSGGEIDKKTAPLIASLGQEVAMLNHKLRSSKESGARISTTLDLLMRSLHQVSEEGPLEEVQAPGGEQDVTEEENSQEAMQIHLAADSQRVEAEDPEKQQLAAQLEVQHRRLLAITSRFLNVEVALLWVPLIATDLLESPVVRFNNIFIVRTRARSALCSATFQSFGCSPSCGVVSGAWVCVVWLKLQLHHRVSARPLLISMAGDWMISPSWVIQSPVSCASRPVHTHPIPAGGAPTTPPPHSTFVVIGFDFCTLSSLSLPVRCVVNN
ncbi:uncharacterized protein [Nerophis lumbriciformis]|uniref:uncharacterized protein isoform X2 n=1 Tax=Nerophis lumbriciformis TaxID=546530 RepID=UPI002AE0A746|nr:uncharacterized protein LOC133619750 isoform X2 [Nerophis lumbriciformis]